MTPDQDKLVGRFWCYGWWTQKWGDVCYIVASLFELFDCRTDAVSSGNAAVIVDSRVNVPDRRGH